MAPETGRPIDEAESLERINNALRGPVIEICQVLIPQLKQYGRAEAYERIMNTPELAAQCLREFRRRPKMFEEILRGPGMTSVSSDDQVLSCGKSLSQIITMIVRTIAKRHFRAKLDAQRRVNWRPPPKRPGLVAAFLRLFRPEPAPQPRRKEASRATALYEAFKEFLLYEWQVILIPHYVRFSPPLVRALGPRILEFRAVEEVVALANGGPIPPPSTPDAAVGAFIPGESQTESGEAQQDALAQRKVDVASILQLVSPDVLRRLNADLGLSKRQIAVLFIRANEVLPKDEFGTFVQSRSHSDDIERFVAAAKQAGLGPASALGACAEFISEFFGSHKR